MRWYAMSAQFLADPKVESLGEAHGPGGPLLIVSLFGHAQLQEDGGRVERTFRAAAHEAFLEHADVARILNDAADTALLTIEHQDERAFVVRFPAWPRWQAAFRKAKSRAAQKPDAQAGVTASHGASQDVTYQTGQDQTTQDRRGTSAAEATDPTRDSAPLSFLLADLIERNGSRRPRVGKRWGESERLLIDRDERDRAEAEQLIRWCQADEFWRGNVLSMPKFREKYDQLRLQAARGSLGKRPAGATSGASADIARLGEMAERMREQEAA